MQTFIYRGAETNLAGIGIVKPGDTIQLEERVADYIARDGNTNFEPVEAKGEEQKKRIAYAKKNPHYDLARVPWERNTVGQLLIGLPPSELTKIANAMNSTKGVQAVKFDRDTDRHKIVDGIIVSAKAAGWMESPEPVKAPAKPEAPKQWELKEGEIAAVSEDENAPAEVKAVAGQIGVIKRIETLDKDNSISYVLLDFEAFAREVNAAPPIIEGQPKLCITLPAKYIVQAPKIDGAPGAAEEELPPKGIA